MIRRKFRYKYSNIAFVCKKRYKGFEKGRIYKPFAYSVKYDDAIDCYTNFALFDNIGKVFIMEKWLIKKGYFTVTLFSELIQNEYVQYMELLSRMNDIDESISHIRETNSNKYIKALEDLKEEEETTDD